MTIALTGFMGCGKSSVGRALSTLLCAPFVDLDEYIMAKAGKQITEIFDAEGEEGFRVIESEALKEVLSESRPGMVLALGGGTVIREANAELIALTCKCIYLRASAETLLCRLEGETAGRPMLRRNGFERLFTARTPVYERVADIVIDTDGLSSQETAKTIVDKIKSNSINI